MNKHPNATAAGLTGAVVTLGLYIGSLFGWEPPPEIAAAIVTVVSAAVLLIPGPKKVERQEVKKRLRKDRAAPHSTK